MRPSRRIIERAINMRHKVSIATILFFVILIGAGCGGEERKKTLTTPFENSRFGFMQGNSYEGMVDLGVHWQRPTLEIFSWNLVEPKKGKYVWKLQDDTVKFTQKYNLNLVADIQPYADWDQEKCHKKLFKEAEPGIPSYGPYRQKPCDMDDYKNFVMKMVERYDGDGLDDMPGLKIPIKYWEVMNEVSDQGPLTDNTFIGTAQEYAEILRATSEAIKKADGQAKVLQGGVAELSPEQVKFLDAVIENGGDRYFDIANIHAVRTQINDFYAKEFKEYLAKRNLSKPFWITEAQLNASAIGQEKLTEEEWAKFMIKSFATAFYHGADKIFYVGLDSSPADPEAWLTRDLKIQKPFYAFQTLVKKIDCFASVEKLAEGQYRFLVDGKWVYVAWDGIPKEIVGRVRVTYWDGQENTLSDASQINLMRGPVFIEKN